MRRSFCHCRPSAGLVLLHDLFPGLAVDALALMNRVLPGPGGIGTLRAPRLRERIGVGAFSSHRPEQKAPPSGIMKWGCGLRSPASRFPILKVSNRRLRGSKSACSGLLFAPTFSQSGRFV